MLSTRIRDLGLSLAGTRMEPVVAEFLQELERRGVRPRPHVYLSTEWGVPFGTISIAIPFYLARPDRETSAAVAVTALVTALAMNHVLRGSYAP